MRVRTLLWLAVAVIVLALGLMAAFGLVLAAVFLILRAADLGLPGAPVRRDCALLLGGSALIVLAEILVVWAWLRRRDDPHPAFPVVTETDESEKSLPSAGCGESNGDADSDVNK